MLRFMGAGIVFLTVFFSSILLIILFSFGGYPFTFRFWLPNSSFNSSNLENVEIGDSLERVIELLGKPTAIEHKSFVYARAVIYPPACPKVWVHFDDDDRVRGVYAKTKIWCLEDDSPYVLTSRDRWKNSDQLAYFFN